MTPPPANTAVSAHVRDDTRAQILAAAAELFAELGYDVSMRRLAKAIGYTATTIYNYFDGKDALVFAVVDEAFQRFRDVVHEQRQRELPPAEKICAMGAKYLAFASAHPHHYRLMFVTRPEFMVGEVPGLDGCRMDGFDFLLDTVAEALGHDHRTEEARTYADAIWAGIHGLTMLHLSMPEGFDDARTQQALVALNQMVHRTFAPA